VDPASVVQSDACSQTVIPGEGHEAAHVVPVKPVHSRHVVVPPSAVHEDTEVGVPVPQQIGPAAEPAQSMGASHCQSTEFMTGHGVPAGSQVDGEEEPDGTSQQCCPAAHVRSLPPSTALKGQYTPAVVSGKSLGGFSHVPVSPPVPESPFVVEVSDAVPESPTGFPVSPDEALSWAAVPESAPPLELDELLHALSEDAPAVATIPAPPRTNMNLANDMTISLSDFPSAATR